MVFIFNNEEKIAIKANDSRIYILDQDYSVQNPVTIAGRVKLKQLPAKWNLRNFLSAALDVLPIRRAIKYALKVLDNQEPLSEIKDKNVLALINVYQRAEKNNFDSESLSALADEVRFIYNKYNN